MAVEDLNPYGQAGLQSFQSRTLDAMDASPDVARVTDNYSIYGMDQLAAPNTADLAAFGAALVQEPDIKEPSVGFNKTTNQVFVNGLTFDADDYQTADRSASAEYLERTPTGLPSGFERMSPEVYGEYIRNIRDPGKGRLMYHNFGIGVDNLQMLLGAGTAFVGDTLGSETISNYGRDVIKQQQEDLRRNEPFQRTFTDDVLAEGEISDWFLANLAQQGPNLLESIAAFVTGAVVATGSTGNPVTGAMGGIAGAFGKTAFKKKLMDAVAKKRAGEALSKAEKRVIAGTGAVVAGALNNFRTGVSDVYLEMLENAEGQVPGSAQRLAALAAAIPYAAAETFSEYFVASKFFNPVGTSSMFRRVAGATGTGAVAEGITEGIQESLVIGTDAATSDREAFTLDNGVRLINAIAAGAAVGGPISGVSQLRRTNEEVDLLDNEGGALATIPPGTAKPMGGGDPSGPAFTITPVNQLEYRPTLPPYTGRAVATPMTPDFEVTPDGVAQEPTYDPMDQPINVQGGFIPGTDANPQGALNVTQPITTPREVNEILGTPTNRIQDQSNVIITPPPVFSDPNQQDLFEDQPETVTTPPPTPTQLPLFTPEQAPKQKPPAKPLTDDIKQPETEFAPSAVPQLENRRDKKDLAATVKSKGQISGGRQEDNIVDPVKRQKKFDTINYTRGIRMNLLPQFVVDRYAEAIKKIKVARRFTNFTGAHHNGGIVLAGRYKYAQPVFPNVVAHELGHASHSLLAEQINDNPAVLAELQAVEDLLYPDLRATILQAINDGKKLDNEFFNYLLSPEELIAEFNVFRLANPEQAAQVAPTLSQLLESVEQAPDLVIDRKTFPIGFGTLVTKATENFDGDFTTVNNFMRDAQERAVKKQTKADSLKKGRTKKEVKDAVQEPETTQVDAQEQTQDGERVGEEVQETPRVRSKKEVLKKGKVKKSSVQTDTKPKAKVAALKRGRQKVDPQVTKSEEVKTKTPQPVVVQTPAERWDANKPYKEYPSLDDFSDKKAVAESLSKMSAEEMQQVWEDSSLRATLPEGVQVDILKAIYQDTTKFEMPTVLTELMDIAFSKTSQASKGVKDRAASFLLNSRVHMPETIRETAIEQLRLAAVGNDLSFTGRPSWFKYAAKLGILPELQQRLETSNLQGVRELMVANNLRQEQVRLDVIANEKDLNKAGTVAASKYGNPKTGPTELARNIAIKLEVIQNTRNLSNRNHRAVQAAERMLSGLEKVKPDMTYRFNGAPLSSYFDSNGKVKFEEQPNGNLVLTSDTLAESRKKERAAKRLARKEGEPSVDLADRVAVERAKERARLAQEEKELFETGNIAEEDLEYYKPKSVLDELKDRNGNFRRYDNDKPSNPMNPIQLRAAVKAFLSKLAIKPKVTIVRNAAELRSKNKALFDRAVKAQPEFETTNASGFSIGDEVIIFTDFVENDTHLKFILAHETIGHFGLRSILNTKQLKSVLENIYNTSAHIRAAADAQMEVYGISKLEAIEEALADHVANMDASVLQRVWDVIKNFLRRIGIPFQHDGASYWVNQLRRYVRDGEIPGFVSPDQLRENIESLNESDVGRFSAARVNLGEQGFSMGIPGLDAKGLQNYLNKGKGKGKNIGRVFGAAAEYLQTLDNTALRSIGLTKLLDVFRRQAATARQILSELDSMTQRATKADFWGLGTGLNKKEKLAVGEMLAYGNAFFAQNTSDADIRNSPDVIIKDPVSGEPMINDDALDAAIERATLSREQIKQGIPYAEGSEANQRKHKLDKVLGESLSDIGPDGKFTNPRHEEMYQAYVDMRRAVNYLAAKVAMGKYIAAAKLAEGNIQSMKNIDRQISDQDLDVFREINEAFQKIYQMGPKQNNGRYRVNAQTLQQAEDFINGVTRAMWQSEASADLRNMKPDDSPFDNPQGNSQKAINAILAYNRTDAGKQNPIDLTSILDGLDRMRQYKDASGNNVFDKNNVIKRIQQPMKDQVFTDTQLINANVMAKQTIFDSYVPYKRRGKHQLRFQAFSVNKDGSRGAPVKLPENFSAAFPYFQNDDFAHLTEMADAYNGDLNQTVFDVPLEEGATQKVIMTALVEDATGGTPTNQSMNYDEFVNVLNSLGVSLDLAERERIVEALSRQHDKARSHLRKRFQAGFDPDMIRSVSEYLETGAAIAAKNEHRTDINLIMADDSNWKGNYDILEQSWADVEAAERTGNKERIHIAREKFETYAHMYKESAPLNGRVFTKATDRKGNKIEIKPTGGKGERYRNQGNKLLSFYAQQTDIAISVEDELSKGPLSGLKNLAVAMQLGGSIAAGLVNLTSLPLMAIPYMATYNSKLGTGGGYGFMQAGIQISKALKDLKNPKWADPAWIRDTVLKGDNYKSFGLTLDEAQFLYRQTSRGILDAALVNSLAGSSRGNFFNSANWTAITKKYMIPFAYTEQQNRRSSALATYRLEKRRRMAADPTLTNASFEQEGDLVNQNDQPDLFALEEKAVEVVNKSQGDYAMYNRPDIARGTWAQYIYMYKQFTVIATQLVRTLPPAGRVYYLTALMAVAGLKGLPFADDLADLVDTLAQLFGIKVPPVELAVGKFIEDTTDAIGLDGTFWAQVALRGFADQIGGGGTVSSRLALGDLLPGTGIFLAGASTPQELKNIAGPIFSAMAGTVTSALDLAKVPFKSDPTNELIRIAQASPIAGLRNIMDTAVYYNTGAVLNSRGYTVTRDISTANLITRFLGFYPVQATRSNDAVRMSKRLVDYTKAISSGYREQYVRAALMKDRSAMRSIEQDVRDHNRVHRRGDPFYIDDFYGKVRKAVRSAEEGAGARFLKTTPKSTRDSITDIISQVYGVDIR